MNTDSYTLNRIDLAAAIGDISSKYNIIVNDQRLNMKYVEGSESDPLLSSNGIEFEEDPMLSPSNKELDLETSLSLDEKELECGGASRWKNLWCCTKAILLRVLMLGFVLCIYSGFGLLMDHIFGDLEVDKEVRSIRYIISLIIAYLMMFWVLLGFWGTIMGDWRWLFNPTFVVERVYKLSSVLAERVQE